MGSVFEEIKSFKNFISPGDEFFFELLNSTNSTIEDTRNILSKYNSKDHLFFAAVDQRALGYARLDIYMQAKFMGFKSLVMKHPSAILAESAVIGENSWIGANAVVFGNVRLGFNSIINNNSVLRANCKISSSFWVGFNSIVFDNCEIGHNVFLGDFLSLKEKTSVGSNCLIEVPFVNEDKIQSGTFISKKFQNSVRIVNG